MPHRRAKTGDKISGAKDLENRLTLVNWFAQKLGYADNGEMLRDLKSSGEEWGGGTNEVLQRIVARKDFPGDGLAETLEKLDANIRGDLEKINRRRPDKIVLKYFQYLAALTSEYILYRLSQSPRNLIHEINAFAARYHPGLKLYQEELGELNKLAFWMATGAGKTLLLHLHYHQYLRYQKSVGKPDNILLVTPNETLTRQHLAEMHLSNIPCAYYTDGEELHNCDSARAVRVIEITKIKINGGKKSGGVSVPAERFGGKNLVFVDEGHKGAGGEVFFDAKSRLAKKGFTFEYSATFGQALAAAGNETLTREYAQSIAVDYSYRYFYGDGYGKDFTVLNLRRETRENQKDILMLGNLLSFCQQRAVFADFQKTDPQFVKKYHLAPPLMLMLGATVTGSNTAVNADVLQLMRFLQKVASDKNGGNRPWLNAAIEKLTSGNSGIGDDGDIFAGSFEYLRKNFPTSDKIRRLLLNTVFRAAAHGGLQIRTFKNVKGEIGLKIGDDGEYFGLVYVGDAAKLRKLAEDHLHGADIREEAIQSPLFHSVAADSSPVNILIGAKKFMEGWSSWRVSGMGLLNVGQSEGAQIIQLFGRGVRLRGLNFSLKRGEFLAENDRHSEYLRLLETLNIFAVKANFMKNFREYLETEGVSWQKMEIPIMRKKEFLDKNLPVPVFPNAEKFDDAVPLQMHANINVKLNKYPGVQRIVGGIQQDAVARDIETVNFDDAALAKIDWESLRLRLLEEKIRNRRHNFIIRPERLRPMLQKCKIAVDAEAKGTVFAAAEDAQMLAFESLCKYADLLFYRAQRKWETAEMGYKILTKEHPNFRNYKIQVPHKAATANIARALEEWKTAVQDLRENVRRADLYRHQDGIPPRIYYDRHLYQPLLVDNGDVSSKAIDKSDPPLIVGSEKIFVQMMKDYAEKYIPDGHEAFLLRNLTRGKGVGFFDEEGVYPDFILWVKGGGKTRVVFIDPHGLAHAKANDGLFRLHENLAAATQKLAKQKEEWKNIEMDAYIISAENFADLRKRVGWDNKTVASLRKKHILFQDTDERKKETVKILLRKN